MKSLKDVLPGEKVKVVKFSADSAAKRRIMDMGITKGADITVIKTAPLGDPVEINVRGYEIHLESLTLKQF